jgi:multiple sugar transport system substrate-binding protein
VFTLATLLLFVAPFALVVAGSLTLPGGVGRSSLRLLDPFSTLAYEGAYAIEPLGDEAWRSLWLALAAVPLATLSASAAGFAIATSSRRTRRVLAGLALAALMVPDPVLWVPRLSLYRDLHLVDTPGPWLLPAAAGLSPFFVLIFCVAYLRVPVTLWDAARVEGRGPIGTWWHVAIPIARPALVAVAVLAAATTWGDATTPLLYTTTDSMRTLPLGIRSLATLDAPKSPIALAGAVVATVPILIAVLAGQRWLLGRRAWFGGAAAALLLLGAVGCGGDDDESTSSAAVPPGQSTPAPGGAGAAGMPNDPIRVIAEGEAEELAGLQAIVSAYEQANPGRKVELEPVEERELLTKLSTEFGSDNPPDAFLINYRFLGTFAAEGAVIPPGDTSAYIPQTLQGLTYNDAVQCLPNNASSPVVYVNTDKMAAPTSWSWDEFRAAADKVKIAVAPRLINAAPFIWSNGGQIVDNDNRPTRLTLTSDPKTKEAIEFLAGVVEANGPGEGEFAGGEEGDEEGEGLREAFSSGEVGLYIDTRKAVAELRETSGLTFDVAPIPLPPGGRPVSALYTDGWCVTAKSKHQDAAKAFVAFAAGPDGARINGLAGRSVPPIQSLAQEILGDTLNPPANSKVWLDAIPTLRAMPHGPGWAEAEEAANEGLKEVFEGEPADEALREPEEEAARALSEG